VKLYPGTHISFLHKVRKDQQDLEISRKYTPISVHTDQVTFIIKVYRENVQTGQKGGVFTNILEKSELGSKFKITGPVGKFIYEGNGHC